MTISGGKDSIILVDLSTLKSVPIGDLPKYPYIDAFWTDRGLEILGDFKSSGPVKPGSGALPQVHFHPSETKVELRIANQWLSWMESGEFLDAFGKKWRPAFDGQSLFRTVGKGRTEFVLVEGYRIAPKPATK